MTPPTAVPGRCCRRPPPRAALHAQTDVIRGKIVAPISHQRATVTVFVRQRLAVGANRKDGRFRQLPGDEATTVTIALGLSKRFEVKRTGDQKCSSPTPSSDGGHAARRMQVNPAIAREPQRRSASRHQRQRASDQRRQRMADQMGDLAALSASMPGVQFIPGADGGPTVLGLASAPIRTRRC